MPDKHLSIGFVRRGHSATGGAEAYLLRLARGIVDLGHEAQLFTSASWPAKEWAFGRINRVSGKSAMQFARAIDRLRQEIRCDVLMSLERIWDCDIYRAGDGVHRAWLLQRSKFEKGRIRSFLRRLSSKHRDALRLEQSLLTDQRAGRVIANSQMVKDEIVRFHKYPADKIDIVRNGVPIERFRFDSARREKARADLKVEHDEIALLFVGTGWERKGLRFAIDAVERCRDLKLRLLVAGRGSPRSYKSDRIQFLGEVADLLPIYAAADIFILPTIYDPFSNACLEALASGLPVITTRSNGFSEIIENGVHGSIVDRADDIEALCNAVLFWSDETRRSSARSTTAQRAAQFDISRNVEQTLAILFQVAARAAST